MFVVKILRKYVLKENELNFEEATSTTDNLAYG